MEVWENTKFKLEIKINDYDLEIEGRNIELTKKHIGGLYRKFDTARKRLKSDHSVEKYFFSCLF